MDIQNKLANKHRVAKKEVMGLYKSLAINQKALGLDDYQLARIEYLKESNPGLYQDSDVLRMESWIRAHKRGNNQDAFLY